MADNRISTYKLIGLIIMGILIRLFLIPQVQYLKHYAHFTTALNDVRSLYENFSSYRLTQGSTYYADPNAINLPIGVIKIFHIVYLGFGEKGI